MSAGSGGLLNAEVDPGAFTSNTRSGHQVGCGRDRFG